MQIWCKVYGVQYIQKCQKFRFVAELFAYLKYLL